MRAVLLGAGMLNPRLVPALYAAGPAELSGRPGLFPTVRYTFVFADSPLACKL